MFGKDSAKQSQKMSEELTNEMPPSSKKMKENERSDKTLPKLTLWPVSQDRMPFSENNAETAMPQEKPAVTRYLMSKYGLCEAFRSFNVTPSVTVNTITSLDGTAEVSFRMGDPNVRLLAELVGKPDEDSYRLSRRFLLQRRVGRKTFSVNIIFPEEGTFHLNIFGRQSAEKDVEAQHIWTYQLYSRYAPMDGERPALDRRYLGYCSPEFDDDGVRTWSHEDPFVVHGGGELCIELEKSRRTHVTFNTTLIRCHRNQEDECPNQVLTRTRGALISFLIKVFEPGYYKFEICSSRASDVIKKRVFNYLIEAKAPSSCTLPFPREQYAWPGDIYLHRPLNGQLSPLRNPMLETFRVEVPDAKAVKIRVEDQEFELTKDDGGIWQMVFDLSPIWKHKEVREVYVCAYGAGKSIEILRYTIN